MKASLQPVLSERGVQAPIHRAPERVRRQAVVVALGPGVAAIFNDGPVARSGARRGRVTLQDEGRPLPRPLVASSLPLLGGGMRHLVLVGEDATALCRRRLLLISGEQPMAMLDPDWLQSPLRVYDELVNGLAPEGRKRLAKILLTAAIPLFNKPKGPAALAALLDKLGSLAVTAKTWRPMGTRARLLSINVPAGRIESLRPVVLLADRVRMLPTAATFLERGEWSDILHLCLPDRLPKDAILAAVGPEPLTVRIENLRAGALVPWIGSRSTELRAWIDGCLLARESTDPVAAAIRDEIRHGAENPPAARLRHIERTRSGILLLAEVDASAPARLRVAVGSVLEELELDPARREICAHFACPDPVPAEAFCRIVLIRPSGRGIVLHDGPVPPGDGSIHPGFARLPHALAAPAVARARMHHPAAPANSCIETFGRPLRTPALSVVTPLGTDPDRLRALIAFIQAEPEAARVETVVVAPGGPPAEGAFRLLAGCAETFGLALRLVIPRQPASCSASLAEGLRAIRSDRALLLGSDTLPARAGWLRRWIGALRPGMAAPLGGALVAPDGTLLHAGGRLDSTADSMPHLRLPSKGLPARDLPARRRTRTGLVTAACVGLGRSAIIAYLDRADHYPDPDIVLSLLASSTPGAATLLDAQAVHYGALPEADRFRDAVDAAALSALLHRSSATEA